MASNMSCNFLKVVASAIVDKYIGESARVIREMFGRLKTTLMFWLLITKRVEVEIVLICLGYAKEHQPCIIFIDEIDAIGGRRFNQGTSADREIQRTLMELLNQLDGFEELGSVKVIMATNRPDVLDPALLRPGRLGEYKIIWNINYSTCFVTDRKIEIPLPNETSRVDILKIHALNISKKGEIGE